MFYFIKKIRSLFSYILITCLDVIKYDSLQGVIRHQWLKSFALLNTYQIEISKIPEVFLSPKL